MAPNITEILFALGLGQRVVGVTRFCDYPADALSIPKIGGLIDPNIEIILSLHPDLVLAFRGNPLRLLERVRELNLPVFILDIGAGLDSLPRLISRIGLVTRREKEAEVLAAGLTARLEVVGERIRDISLRPRVLVLLHGQGLWTCGGQSYLNDLIARAGAENIAAAVPKKWTLYSRERIIRDDPEAVFVLAKSEAEFGQARLWLAAEGHLESLKAVKSNRVFYLDENAASRYGPRLLGILEEIARDLHPDRFGGGQ